MQGDRPTIEECNSLGRERLRQLNALATAKPADYFARLCELPWVRIHEVIDHPLTHWGGVYLPLQDCVDLLRDVALNQRGPGILGYLEHLELSFSFRAQAYYRLQDRVVHLNMGLFLFLNELEATCRWLESILFKETAMLSATEHSRYEAPPAVYDELATLFRAGSDGLPVSGKYGLVHPLARVLSRFVIAHELGHLIDFAESPQLRAHRREAIWSYYEDALQHCLTDGRIDRARYARFMSPSFLEQVASQWATEFVADALGLETVAGLLPRDGIDPHHAYKMIQTAVELFFHMIVLVYRADRGTDSHPPPTLRSEVIRAGCRNAHRVGWPQFLNEIWGAGFITSQLLIAASIKIGGNPCNHPANP